MISKFQSMESELQLNGSGITNLDCSCHIINMYNDSSAFVIGTLTRSCSVERFHSMNMSYNTPMKHISYIHFGNQQPRGRSGRHPEPRLLSSSRNPSANVPLRFDVARIAESIPGMANIPGQGQGTYTSVDICI